MAVKTSEMAGVDAASKASALEAKIQAIRDMRSIATARGGCVRESIVEYFGEKTTRRRRSIAVRIVEWLLLRSSRVKRTKFCCDQCDGVRVDRVDDVIDWATEVFAQRH